MEIKCVTASLAGPSQVCGIHIIIIIIIVHVRVAFRFQHVLLLYGTYAAAGVHKITLLSKTITTKLDWVGLDFVCGRGGGGSGGRLKKKG